MISILINIILSTLFISGGVFVFLKLRKTKWHPGITLFLVCIYVVLFTLTLSFVVIPLFNEGRFQNMLSDYLYWFGYVVLIPSIYISGGAIVWFLFYFLQKLNKP